MAGSRAGFAQADPSPYCQVVAREFVDRVVHQSQIRRVIGAPELQGEMVETSQASLFRRYRIGSSTTWCPTG